MSLFQKSIGEIKAWQMVSLWRPMKSLAYGGAAFLPVPVSTSYRKCLSTNENCYY